MINRRSPMQWHRLLLPTPLQVDPARSALTALAGLAGQPRVVLEAVGAIGTVQWRLGVEGDHMPRVLAALRAHLPGLRSEPIAATFDGLQRVDLAAGLRISGDRRRALKAEATEPVVRGLLASLASTRKREALYVQLILGPRSRPARSPEPRRPQLARTDRAAERRKEAEHSFACTVRIAASSADPARARNLINSAAGSLRGLEVPGVAIRLSRAGVLPFSDARSPWFWTNYLSVSDVLPLTGWPIGELPLPGVAAAHPKLLPAADVLPSKGRVLGVATADRSSNAERPVAIKDEDSLRHLHVLGPTGSGKSQVLGNLALQSMAAGQSVVVLDPKGALVDDLLRRIPEARQGDVVVIDPLDGAPVGLNGLRPGADADRSADALLGVFHSLYADNWGPRTHDILHASLLTLARRGDASLAMIPTLLTNPGFRRSVVGHVAKDDPMGLGAFWGWFEAISDAERLQAVSPLMNKLRPILLRPGMRGVFGQRQPRFDLSDVFTRRRIVLISLAKGRLGPEAAQLLGTIAVALIWDAAQVNASRGGNPRHVSLIIDEVQDYLRIGDIGDALAQARSMGLGITAANQSFSQFSPSMREAFLTNARSRVAFQQSPRDARELASISRGQVEADDLLALPAYQAYAQVLVDGTPAPWVSLSTRLMPPATSNPAAIRHLSRSQYGQPLTDIEADLIALTMPSRTGGGERIGRSRRTSADDDRGGTS